MDFSLEDMVVPDSVSPEWIAAIRVRNDSLADAVGTTDLSREPDELLPKWQNPLERKRMMIARVDGEIVGRATYETEDDSPVAWVSVDVLPSFRRHGIGAALHDRVVELARSEKKSTLQDYVLDQGRSGDVIDSPTGFGSVPRDSAPSRFLRRHGYALEQVGRMSVLVLPCDISSLYNGAVESAGSDYVVRTYVGRTPDDLLADMALLRSSMGSDAPSAGMEMENIWTPERVRADDDAMESSPRTMLTAIVHHAPTGAVAGYSELDIPPEIHRPIAQGDTIVLAAHRGRRLGMLLKLSNIARLDDVAPGHPSITTTNAEDNTHMLAVNVAVGFLPWATMGAWKKEL